MFSIKETHECVIEETIGSGSPPAKLATPSSPIYRLGCATLSKWNLRVQNKPGPPIPSTLNLWTSNSKSVVRGQLLRSQRWEGGADITIDHPSLLIVQVEEDGGLGVSEWVEGSRGSVRWFCKEIFLFLFF